MRASFLVLTLAAASILPSLAFAQDQSRTVVTLTPRYLSAGTTVSSFEYRGEVPYADARFRPASYNLAGRFTDWTQDPWAVPTANRGHSVDWDTFFTRGARRY